MSIYHKLSPSTTVTKATSFKEPSFVCKTVPQLNAVNFGEASSQVGEWEIYQGGKAVGWETTEQQPCFNSHYGATSQSWEWLAGWTKRQAGECKKRWLDGKKENKCHWVALKGINVYRQCLDHSTNMFWAAISSYWKGRWAASEKQQEKKKSTEWLGKKRGGNSRTKNGGLTFCPQRLMEINTDDLKGIRPQAGWKKPIRISIASSPVLIISRRNEVLSLKLQKRMAIA